MDFGNKGSIDKAEMLTLCESVIKGISKMLKHPIARCINARNLEIKCNKIAETHPTGRISVLE